MSDERWMRIDRVLQSALGRPPHEREAFIRDACADDEGVRDEVLSLLAHAGSADKFLEPPPAREPLQPGARLGAYEIRAHIGEGGMGEVYRAHDSRLRRDIALKILPPEAADAERRQRFAREAQAVAALNHPGIVTIHSVEQSGDIHFLTMELVDGQTLDVLMPAGGFPIDRLLALAVPLADAVGAAHGQGIVHRDLKPANVMVTRDGRVKVMDFGLAKLSRRATLQDAKGASVTTMSGQLTEDGRVFGTVAYMSPEQAEGRDVDHRSDVFSLGVLLFELATGRRPFKGDTQVAVLASIVKDTPPPITDLKPGLPAGFARLVKKCLTKDPARRYQSVLDVRNDLEEIREDLESPDHAGGPGKQRRPWFWLTAGLAAGLIVAAAASFAYWLPPPPSDPRFETVTDAVGLEESPAISPDGKTVAYVAYTGRRRQIWIRRLDGGASQVTTADLDHEQPRWDPNSTTLLYFTRPATEETKEPHGKLWEVSMLGGTPRPIAAALGAGDISHDGLRIATFQLIGDLPTLVVLRRDGSLISVVSKLKIAGGRTPRWSPDDRSIAFVELKNATFSYTLTVVAAAGGKRQELDTAHFYSGVSWLSDGSGLVYGSAQGSTVPYPPTYQLRLKRLSGGDSEQLTFGDDGFTEPDLHESGLLFATRTKIRSALVGVPTTGTAAANSEAAVPLTHQTSQVQTPSASRDGKRIVYLSDSGGHGNLWITDSEGKNRKQITFERDTLITVGVPVLSPDGSQIAFITGTRRAAALGRLNEQWLVKPDGLDRRKLLDDARSAAWSPKGDWLYYGVLETRPCIEKVRVVEGTAASTKRIRCDSAIAPMPRQDGTLFFQTMSPAPNGGYDYELRKASPEDGASTLLRRIEGRRLPYDSIYAIPAALSPDGKWVAFVEMDGATADLWKMSTDGGAPVRITDFGDRALWIVRQITWAGPDGRFIYAALADVDADIVSIAGVVSGKEK
jgi:serine/threonine protein kinase/Tol biopolymer transport system component